MKVAADRPGRFTPTEYMALLQVSLHAVRILLDLRIFRYVDGGNCNPATLSRVLRQLGLVLYLRTPMNTIRGRCMGMLGELCPTAQMCSRGCVVFVDAGPDLAVCSYAGERARSRGHK